MEEINISINNNLGEDQLIKILEEHDIPFRVETKTDSAFPNLNHTVNIFIPRSYHKTYLSLIGMEESTTLPSSTSSKSYKSTIFQIGLFLYALIMTMLCLKFYQTINRTSEDKNFYSKWNFDNTSFIQKSKKTNQVISVYTDKNFDMNYELVEGFYPTIISPE